MKEQRCTHRVLKFLVYCIIFESMTCRIFAIYVEYIYTYKLLLLDFKNCKDSHQWIFCLAACRSLRQKVE